MTNKKLIIISVAISVLLGTIVGVFIGRATKENDNRFSVQVISTYKTTLGNMYYTLCRYDRHTGKTWVIAGVTYDLYTTSFLGKSWHEIMEPIEEDVEEDHTKAINSQGNSPPSKSDVKENNLEK